MSDNLILALAADASSLSMRGYILLGFVVFLFAGAGLALLIGRKWIKIRSARQMSALSGEGGGARFGDDRPDASVDWWNETVTTADEVEVAPAWQKAMLGPDSDELGNALTGAPVAPAPPGYGRSRPVTPAVPVAPAVAVEAPVEVAPEPVAEPESEVLFGGDGPYPWRATEEAAVEPVAPVVSEDVFPAVEEAFPSVVAEDAFPAVEEVRPVAYVPPVPIQPVQPVQPVAYVPPVPGQPVPPVRPVRPVEPVVAAPYVPSNVQPIVPEADPAPEAAVAEEGWGAGSDENSVGDSWWRQALADDN